MSPRSARRAAAAGAEAEAARQADAAKTVILHAVSHDLRSPLTAIRTAAAGLREEGTDPEDRVALIDAIEEEADRLTRLIGNLLDLSRIEAGRRPSPHGLVRPARRDLHRPSPTSATRSRRGGSRSSSTASCRWCARTPRSSSASSPT